MHAYWSLMISSSGQVTDGFGVPDGENFNKIHGWIMWASWGVFGFIQLLSNRYLKPLWQVNMWIHRISGFLILVGTFVLGFLAIKNLDWEIVSMAHTIVGFSILICVGLVIIGGIVARYSLENFRWNTKTSQLFRYIHKSFGVFLLLVAQVNILLGVIKYA